MNGKFILLAMICMNLMTVVFSYGCADVGSACFESASNNFVLGSIVKIETLEELDQSGGISFNESFEAQVEGMVQERAGVGTQLTGFASNFLDGLRMIGAILSFFTPLPLIGFFNSLAFPVWLNAILGLPLIILYIASLMELYRGAGF